MLPEPGSRALSNRNVRASGLVPLGATSILDVGCGTGDDVLALAELYGPNTLVVGLEARLELVDEAQRRARNVALNVRFAVGDARSLPFADASFDLVHSDALPQDADERARVVRELARVLRPGGRLVVQDHDRLVTGHAPFVSELGAAEARGDELEELLERAGLVGLETWACRD
jgi:ubiquinone/menaquinone biosynthesis C-methylase UbiE